MQAELPTPHFNADGLIPAVVQDINTGAVLMLAYMNEESLLKTLDTGETHFWSRSRKEIWRKGETSGNRQKVVRMSMDCDADTLLVQVEQTGVACHTGAYSCFFTDIRPADERAAVLPQVIANLATVIHQRKVEMPDGSYTTKLFMAGLDRILKKVGEEAGEVIIAAKNQDHGEIAWEVADLLYHVMVMLEASDVPLSAIGGELSKRAKPGDVR